MLGLVPGLGLVDAQKLPAKKEILTTMTLANEYLMNKWWTDWPVANCIK